MTDTDSPEIIDESECVVYGLVAMRVILHGVSHYVGHFVESPVVEGLHGVEDAAL